MSIVKGQKLHGIPLDLQKKNPLKFFEDVVSDPQLKINRLYVVTMDLQKKSFIELAESLHYGRR